MVLAVCLVFLSLGKDVMMPITRSPLRDEAGMLRILDLIRTMPIACRHVIDLP